MVAAWPGLLSSDPCTRRRSEATLGLLWVSHPRGLTLRRPQLLCADLADPASVATRVLLQTCFGLSSAEVYELVGCAASGEAERLACRLSYAEMNGLPLQGPAASSAANSAAAAGNTAAPASNSSGGSSSAAPGTAAEQTAARAAELSVDDVASLPDEQLLPRMQKLASSASKPWPSSAHFAAFAASFAKRSEWRHLQTAAAAESARLLRLLRGAA